MGCCDSKETSESSGVKTAGHGVQLQELNRMPSALETNVKKGGFKKEQFILDKTGDIRAIYEINTNKLGEGSFGTVSKAKHRTSGETAAVKVVTKKDIKNVNRFRQEIGIMKVMDHPNIIRLFETYEDQSSIYLVMEVADGGELFDRIVEAKRFDEKQAARVIQQVLRAIFYMHENHVCHRDLKPENFLFMTKDPIATATLKIIDFGLSTPFRPGDTLKSKAGTPYYVAPQVLDGKYNEKSDLWSVGVIMYVLLCGYPPFYAKNDAEVLKKVREGRFSFNKKDWKNVSGDAMNLIKLLLTKDPDARPSAAEALKHRWVDQMAPEATSEPLEASVISNLRHFKNNNKLKKAALGIIAGKMGESQIKTLRGIFTSLDANGDGMLTKTELVKGIKEAGIQAPPDLQEIIDDIDCDGNGYIEYSEFIAAAMTRRQYLEDQALYGAFAVFDIDGDGQISRAELQALLQQKAKEVSGALPKGRTVDNILDQYAGGDELISFEEFKAMMRG